MKEQIVDIKSLTKLENICQSIVKDLKKPALLLLQGKLGSGKTTFTKYFSQNLGIDQNLVKSPTFSLINLYKNAQGQKIYHLDLYRIEEIDSILLEEIKEIISVPDNITLIEWPEKLPQNFFNNYLGTIFFLNFEFVPTQKRTLKIRTEIFK